MDSLGSDLIGHIMSFLTARSLVYFYSCCRRFRRCAAQSGAWSHVIHSRNFCEGVESGVVLLRHPREYRTECDPPFDPWAKPGQSSGDYTDEKHLRLYAFAAFTAAAITVEEDDYEQQLPLNMALEMIENEGGDPRDWSILLTPNHVHPYLFVEINTFRTLTVRTIGCYDTPALIVPNPDVYPTGVGIQPNLTTSPSSSSSSSSSPVTRPTIRIVDIHVRWERTQRELAPPDAEVQGFGFSCTGECQVTLERCTAERCPTQSFIVCGEQLEASLVECSSLFSKGAAFSVEGPLRRGSMTRCQARDSDLYPFGFDCSYPICSFEMSECSVNNSGPGAALIFWIPQNPSSPGTHIRVSDCNFTMADQGMVFTPMLSNPAREDASAQDPNNSEPKRLKRDNSTFSVTNCSFTHLKSHAVKIVTPLEDCAIQLVDNSFSAVAGGNLVVTGPGRDTYQSYTTVTNNMFPHERPLSTEITQLCKQGKCTLERTQSTYELQEWYACITCNLVNDLGICKSCVEICHAGHQTYMDAAMIDAYCDCQTIPSVNRCQLKK